MLVVFLKICYIYFREGKEGNTSVLSGKKGKLNRLEKKG